ncbi:hypothetical protein Goshw_018808, partial [Gossypium schwendimanii]|nr:hypothetical protein [Gossypium schwendimanii]
EATLNPINLQTETKAFYKKLWNLQIPPKIKITIWGISWNYIPTFVNIKIKTVVADARCPRCNQEEEDNNHVFRGCPTTTELRGVEEKKLNLAASGGPKFEERRTSVAVYFDAAFDQQLSRFA